MSILGWMLFTGEGSEGIVVPDLQEGLRLMHKAAQAGESRAMVNLAVAILQRKEEEVAHMEVSLAP